MANTQIHNTQIHNGKSRGIESRSHDGITLRSGRHTQYESPTTRRQATPSLECNHPNCLVDVVAPDNAGE